MDVGIDGDCGNVEGLRHHDRGGFVTNAGERFECGETFWNAGLVFCDKDLGEVVNGARFGGRKATGADDSLDLRDGEGKHFFWRVG